jgi:hypothetical protein
MALSSCGSSHTYTFTRQANGATDIDIRIAREGRNLKGWALAFLLGTFRGRVLKRKFENSVKAIEARGPARWRTIKRITRYECRWEQFINACSEESDVKGS